MTQPSPPSRTVSLPVVQADACATRHAPRMGATRTGRWRFWVLVAVHVLMAAHLIQWAVMGMTLSPLEPSESMETLELGVINAGAVLFALALLSTLVFGRFFCGWLCHVVALQDACAWLMNRVGIRPKPFRSRLLVFAPLVIGSYMFLWPNFKRFAVVPALEAADIAWPAWLKPVAPTNVWRSELFVEDFWATFPDWYIAVPFLLICGFATVYFLGAKGFCTYACPYGGLFAPIDKLAPVRIRVTDACMHCGHCTSVCTSNVRVSDEVRDFGMVVDPGCMKCMDCVTACPSDALYLGLGAPAVLKKVRDHDHHAKSKAKAARRYDLTLPEELAAAAIFIAAFLSTRGMLDQIPMLLAGGLAAIVTFLTMTAWWTLTRPNARVYGLILKQKSRLRPAGIGFTLLTLAVLAAVAWGGQARYPRWRADIAYAAATLPAGLVVRPEFAAGPDTLATARRAEAWLTRADSPSNGGTGWRLNPEHRTRLAYYLALQGKLAQAADALETVVEEGRPADPLINQLVALRQATGATDGDIRELYKKALALHPALHSVRQKLAIEAAMNGDPVTGEAYWAVDDEAITSQIPFRLAQISFYMAQGEAERALGVLDTAIELARAEKHHASGWLADCAGAAMRLGQADQARYLIDQALQAEGLHAGVFFAAAEVEATFGDLEAARRRIDEGLAFKGGDQAAPLARAASLLLRLRDVERGTELYKQAVAASRQPFERSQLGFAMARAGAGLSNPALSQAGLAAMTEAAETSGEPMIWHDLAMVRYEARQFGPAFEAIIQAAELAPHSPIMARRVADVAGLIGDPARVAEWNAEADRREQRTD